MRRGEAWTAFLATALAVAALTVAGAPPANAQTATQPSLGEGAWSWFADPRAVRHDGSRRQTYLGWVSDDGDVKVSAYDHDTFTRTTAVIHERLQVDDHANPALQIRPDGRVVAYYSAHNGLEMLYRVSTRPEDVTDWGPPQKVSTNVAGSRGYTYPNPIRLSSESRTYLFWRGGNWNPTFSTQEDGQSTWAPARNLIVEAGQRPYVKYSSNGTDTIGFAFTNAHPSVSGSTNIYFARVRAGRIERADGTQIGTLGTPIAPGQGDTVYDTATDAFPGQSDAWVHDTALDSSGRPVVVFAVFASGSDHRYFYARWTGTAWQRTQITPAGGSFSADGREPYYSGGITLDHEDPSRVYLSRQVNGVFEVETRTTSDGGASWSVQPVTSASSENNVRPVSPRGTIAFGGDMSLLWMRGDYNSYLTYGTSIAALLANGGEAPVADVEQTPSGSQAPVTVAFDGSGSRDPDGSVASWSWDFGDGTTGSGATTSHVYTQPGRYFAKLTVTDNEGATDVHVSEVEVGVPKAPSADTGGANPVAAASATVHGTVDPNAQATTYRFEYGLTESYGAFTGERSAAGTGHQQVNGSLTGLTAGRTYHYRLVARNATGQTVGADRTFTAGSGAPPSAYRDAVLGTAGLRTYWRMGEASGTAAANQRGGPAGLFGGRFRLGELGALTGDRDTAAHFAGTTGSEMAGSGPSLTGTATLEGWFHWSTGVAVARDNTGASGSGWILALDGGGRLFYRLGGSSFDTGLPTSSVRDGWHHLVATKNGGATAFYIDGQLVHSGTGAGSTASQTTWHVMRNGATAQYSEGRADEVALYDTALPASEVQRHYEIGTSDRNRPNTWIVGGPSGTTQSNSPSFGLTADEPGTFTCRLDGPGSRVGATAACSSPKAFSRLANGAYVLRVTARDLAGNADSTAATRSFTVAVPRAAAAPTNAPATKAPAPAAAISSDEVVGALRADLRAGARLLRRLGIRRLLRRRGARVGQVDSLLGGKFALSAKRGRTTVLLGERRFATAGKGAVRLKLTRRGRRLLGRSRRLRLTLRASFTDADGRRVSARRGVTLGS